MRCSGTVSIAFTVAIVRVKKTHINTINIAVWLPIPNNTRASGIHAIGAIGAKSSIIGIKKRFIQIDVFKKTHAKSAQINPMIRPVKTRKKLEIIEAGILAACDQSPILKLFSAISSINCEGGGNIRLYCHSIFAEISHSKMSTVREASPQINESVFSVIFMIIVGYF